MAVACLVSLPVAAVGLFCLKALLLAAAALLTCVGILVVVVLGVAHVVRLPTWRLLRKFPGPNEDIPLLWSVALHRKATATMHVVPYNVTTFQARIGMFTQYKKEGLCRFYVGTFGNVAVHRADYVEVVLTHPATASKSMDYEFLQSWLGTGLLTSGGSKWRTRRKMLTPAFHFRILEQFVGPMNKHARGLVRKLRDHQDKGFVDIVPFATDSTLNVLLETIMGVDPTTQKDERALYLSAVQRLAGELVRRALTIWHLLDCIYYRSEYGKQNKRDLDVVHAFTMKVIEKRKKELLEGFSAGEGTVTASSENGNIKKRKTFLDILLEHSFLNKGSLSDADIREEVDTFMFEGHDTTSTGISWALYLIGLHPEVQKKLQNELDSVLGSAYDEDITQEHLKEMPYFDRVLKECQRLYPSVPVIGRHATDDFTLGKYTVPKGTTVDIIIYALHRDPDVYPQPEEFRPERFLPENCRDRHPFAYLPFSGASRNCIGQRYAMQEIKIAVATVIRCFEVQPLEPRDKVLICSELVLKAPGGLKMKLVPRSLPKPTE